jgi:hypothetical protein
MVSKTFMEGGEEVGGVLSALCRRTREAKRRSLASDLSTIVFLGLVPRIELSGA